MVANNIPIKKISTNHVKQVGLGGPFVLFGWVVLRAEEERALAAHFKSKSP